MNRSIPLPCQGSCGAQCTGSGLNTPQKKSIAQGSWPQLCTAVGRDANTCTASLHAAEYNIRSTHAGMPCQHARACMHGVKGITQQFAEELSRWTFNRQMRITHSLRCGCLEPSTQLHRYLYTCSQTECMSMATQPYSCLASLHCNAFHCKRFLSLGLWMCFYLVKQL